MRQSACCPVRSIASLGCDENTGYFYRPQRGISVTISQLTATQGNAMPQVSRQPTYFLSHGGGPWPWMRDQTGGIYDVLADSLAQLPSQLPQPPRAILMVSAHWEAARFTVGTHPHPPMVYDYYGFPEHTYHIRYQAPGDPALAHQVQERLQAAGIDVDTDPARGYDHGCFVPMALIAPDAQIPVVQLSLKKGLSPAAHIEAGQALAGLRDEGVLILGSGLSFHNLRLFNAAGGPASQAFDAWLNETLLSHSTDLRRQRLLQWETAPAARQAHAREEHLLPLMVALGAALDEPATCVYHEDAFAGGIAVSSFRFG